jgi:oligoribonuclease NrnB/cAMP/cGMP phosphodiesterase (DHH superfamily)
MHQSYVNFLIKGCTQCPVSDSKYRLVTRSDFDGLVCAVLLKHLNLVDEIKFVHPKDMQDGKVEVSANDITTNLPFVPAVYMAFDHHLSEMIRNDQADNYIIDAKAPSAARVVFEYYGGYDVFPKEWEDMLIAVDITDPAQYERHDILDPKGWSLLNFLIIDERIYILTKTLSIFLSKNIKLHAYVFDSGQFHRSINYC